MPRTLLSSPAPSPRVAHAPAILWAEDSTEDQLLIRAALEDLPGAPPVTFASDGVHLLAELETARPSLVVLDLRMPRLGGLEALRRIRADPRLRHLRVCVFSAGNQPGEVAACRELGAIEVAAKPVDFGKYTAAVHGLARRA